MAYAYDRLSYLQLFWAAQAGVAGLKLLSSVCFGRHVNHRATERCPTGRGRFQTRVRFHNLVSIICNGSIWWKVTSACLWSHPLDGVTSAGLGIFAAPKVAASDGTAVLLAATLLLAHAARRLDDSLRVNVFSHRQTQNILQVALSYVTPVAVALSLVAEIGDVTECFSWRYLRPIQLPAVLLFIFASRAQHQCYVGLRKLRRNRAGHVVTTSYKMPKGGWFDLVSCPQYLCEVLIYASLGVVLGTGSATWWTLVGYVVATQLRLAQSAHAWYRHRFPEYPKDRKMVVPYIL